MPKELDLVDEVDRASIASMDVKCIRGLNGYRDDGIHSLVPVPWMTLPCSRILGFIGTIIKPHLRNNCCLNKYQQDSAVSKQ